ncbi:hypothetical protein LEP1GSC193_1689 [Leptospira alstonii serovar Pingchang str. 80-412]|uniref:Uncharacterized protein n=2 Tax=Leptospira alstonii TaxID=28452 RepID=M6D5Y9_9LEPT|nr:hypothetical protein LEP1GSC194_4303 [Leptospira alstonii serovar Sichuan str. 79601]EQA78815.1 hypothetical protein LEP1GSC193_1689 [Leptospira alstonii serovar Pingchang str. 80-412]
MVVETCNKKQGHYHSSLAPPYQKSEYSNEKKRHIPRKGFKQQRALMRVWIQRFYPKRKQKSKGHSTE